MHIHVVKVLYRATSKTMLVRAKNYEGAVKKILRLKEHRDLPNIECYLMETRPDDRMRGI